MKIENFEENSIENIFRQAQAKIAFSFFLFKAWLTHVLVRAQH
jgi:hypothetical protein